MPLLAILLACVWLAGCADLSAPPHAPTSPAPGTASHSSPLVIAQRTHEFPAARPSPQRAGHGAGTPTAALRAFAAAYINWDAQSVAGDLRRLARRCIGAARSELQMAAANAAQDYELRRGGIANSGIVEAIAPLRGSGNRYVVVTLERTTAANSSAYDGLRPAWHLTLATLARQRAPAGWVLSAWQPEN